MYWVVMFTIFVPTKFHMPSCDDSLIIANRPKPYAYSVLPPFCTVTFCKKLHLWNLCIFWSFSGIHHVRILD